MGFKKCVVTVYNIMTCAHVRVARVYLLRAGGGEGEGEGEGVGVGGGGGGGGGGETRREIKNPTMRKYDVKYLVSLRGEYTHLAC